MQENEVAVPCQWVEKRKDSRSVSATGFMLRVMFFFWIFFFLRLNKKKEKGKDMMAPRYGGGGFLKIKGSDRDSQRQGHLRELRVDMT